MVGTINTVSHECTHLSGPPVLSCFSINGWNGHATRRGSKSHSAHVPLWHLCTSRPSRLWNHMLHLCHCAARLCSLSGFCLSSIHLCWALSPSLWNSLLHLANHTGWCGCQQWRSLYQVSSGTSMTVRSLRITSLHFLIGPPGGWGWGNHPNSIYFGIRCSGILTTCTWPNHSSLLVTLLDSGSDLPRAILARAWEVP